MCSDVLTCEGRRLTGLPRRSCALGDEATGIIELVIDARGRPVCAVPEALVQEYHVSLDPSA